MGFKFGKLLKGLADVGIGIATLSPKTTIKGLGGTLSSFVKGPTTPKFIAKAITSQPRQVSRGRFGLSFKSLTVAATKRIRLGDPRVRTQPSLKQLERRRITKLNRLARLSGRLKPFIADVKKKVMATATKTSFGTKMSNVVGGFEFGRGSRDKFIINALIIVGVVVVIIFGGNILFGKVTRRK